MKTRLNRRRSAFGAGLAVVAAVSIGSPGTSQRAAARVAATTVPFALLSQNASSNPSVSGNGEFVVYTAAPGTEDGRTSSVWVTDRKDRTPVELTQPREGVRLGNSVNPVISANGCVVVVTTEMGYDLFRDDDRGSRWDVYRAIMPWCGGRANDWEIVSTLVSTDGLAQARGDIDPLQPAAVSGAGSVVAYVRPFESLSGVDGSAHRPGAIDVVDLSIPIEDPTRTTKSPGLPSDVTGGAVIHIGQRGPALSGDGSTVVFTSDATSNQAVPDWVPPADGTNTSPTQVFAWNRNDLDPFTAVTLISQGADGPANAGASEPAVSSDGRFVAFTSAATNLDPRADLTACGTACPTQVYVIDRDTDRGEDVVPTFDEPGTTKVSLISAVDDPAAMRLVAGNGPSFLPSVSGDGHTIVFATQSNNLMAVQTPGGGDSTDGDLLIADLDTNTLRRAFDSTAPAPGAHSHPHLSANGRVLVADSLVAKQLGPLPLYTDPAFVGRQVVAASYQPKLSIAALDWGTIMLGVPGPEWYVNVVNEGPGSFTPAMVKSDNPDFFITGGSCLEMSPVRAGQSCSVSMIFTPTVPGPATSTLTISEYGYEAVTLSSQVRGAGGEPALISDQTGQDFGSTLVGTKANDTALFNISNISIAPTAISSVRFTGANTKDFVVSSNGCRGELGIGLSCPLEVSFTPTGAGRRTATLNIGTPLGQYTSVLLSGEGFYQANLIVPAPIVKPGDLVGFGLSGFPADTDVVVGWSDGAGAVAVLRTDKNGNVPMGALPVRPGTRPGTHTLVAQVINGPSASVPVEIERIPKRTIAPTFPKR